MGKWDDGLTAIMAVVLGTFIAVAIPIGWAYVFTSEPPKAGDWIGFAGSMLSAGVALFAARIAWRAVQRQIDVQREANLLGVLTREEDRLEAEVRAVEICMLMIIRARDARSASDIINYYARLKDAGLVEDQQEMRRIVRERVGDPVPLGLIDITAYPLARLTNALRKCRDASAEGDGAGGVIYKPVTANTGVEEAEMHLDSAARNLADTLNAIERRLSVYRTRIEAGLTELTHNSSALVR